MFHTIEEFHTDWAFETKATRKLLDRLTDESLGTHVEDDGRTIGRLAWHIAQTIPEMMARTGLHVRGLGEHDPVPARAAEIAAAYGAAAASLSEEVRAHWNDDTLALMDDMYGEQWSRGSTLGILISHQTHHRGQLTVLMRKAGLPVPGIYGPSREEWAQWGMEPPKV